MSDDNNDKMTETPCVVDNTVYYRNSVGETVSYQLLVSVVEPPKKKWWMFWRRT